MDWRRFIMCVTTEFHGLKGSRCLAGREWLYRADRALIQVKRAGWPRSADVRSTPNSGHLRCSSDVRFIPIADICAASH